MQYHAIPCNIMQNNAIPCNTIKYHTIQCNTMKYHAMPCNTLAYSGILWHTLAYSGILWHALAYSGIINASLITADGAYHCPVGSIWPFLTFISGYHYLLSGSNNDKLSNDGTGPTAYHFIKGTSVLNAIILAEFFRGAGP